MNNSIEKNGTYGFGNSDESILRELFIEHLVQVHCAKAHAAERLPELANQAEFMDLHTTIEHTVGKINRQLDRIYHLFKLLDTPIDIHDCDHIIVMMESAFSLIHKRGGDIFNRDLAILYYLQNISGVEESSFQMLDLIASQMNNYHIKLLIKENHEDTKKSNPLSLLLRERYLNRH